MSPTEVESPESLAARRGAADREAMEIAEAAREAEWKHASFAADLFGGRFRPDLILPFPVQDEEDRRRGDEFLARLEPFLAESVDAEEIDRTGEIPDGVLRGLAALGCFGMKIPREFGGLGFSQVNYNRAMQLIGSHCGSTAVLISAHQSIGVPQPLKLFGTEEQKRRYLPRLAAGEISAFALTEPGVGSDPANMSTVAMPTLDGSAYILNGEKLWCTNGPIADILIVMARTPSVIVDGKERKQITAFIVERTMPGFEVAHRCRFLGLTAIQNGLIRFRDLRVPRENVLWEPGSGLKLALITLNTGRLTVPAATTGMAKRCLAIARRWAGTRVQWGAPIGRHDAVAGMIADIAAGAFAMDAVTWLASGLADRGGADIRLEAAMAKLFCSETAWRIADETLQVRGGRGYESARSLRDRGEEAVPVERMFRDCRINRIIEGTSEIMRLFIAREALDRHLRIAGPLLDPRASAGRKVRAALGAAGTYAVWYPGLWIPWRRGGKLPVLEDPLAGHFRFIDRTGRRLARSIFHAMTVHRAGLEKRQRILARLVDIGVDLFAMAAAVAHAHTLGLKAVNWPLGAAAGAGSGPAAADGATGSPADLADLFCREARRRIRRNFRDLRSNDDRAGYRLARAVLEGKYGWLEKGILDRPGMPR